MTDMPDMPDMNNPSVIEQASKALAKLRAIDKRGSDSIARRQLALAQQRAEFIGGLPFVVREALVTYDHISAAEHDLPYRAST